MSRRGAYLRNNTVYIYIYIYQKKKIITVLFLENNSAQSPNCVLTRMPFYFLSLLSIVNFMLYAFDVKSRDNVIINTAWLYIYNDVCKWDLLTLSSRSGLQLQLGTY